MKCSKCGNELNGKFCTNCGAPAPANPVCPTCGEEVKGKFCTKCGTPAPQANAVTAPVAEPVESVDEFATEVLQPQSDEPNQNDYETQILDTQPVQYGQTQPVYDQQFSNQPNDRFVGQQFTNQPINNAPGGKKPMSGGKVVAIVLGVVAALVILISIIIGVLVVKFAKSVEEELYDIEDSSFVYSYEIYEEDTTEETIEETTEEIIDDVYEEKLDTRTGLRYKQVDADSVEIIGYEADYSFTGKTLDVIIPSEIDGKTVADISFLGVWDFYDQDVHIKVTIPGSIKSLSSYSLSFNDDIDEVVIEDGVETLESDAFTGCDDLEKVTVPESVTMMDDCGLGLDVDDDDYFGREPIDDFVMYGKKGSAAEAYCKELGLTFVEKK